MAGHLRKLVARDDQIDLLAGAEDQMHRCFLARGQQLLGLARLHLQAARILERRRIDVGPLQDRAEQTVIEIVTAQRRIAIGRQDLEHATGELEDRQVKGAATKVVDRIDTLGRIVQAVGDGCRRGFVEQAQNVQTR